MTASKDEITGALSLATPAVTTRHKSRRVGPAHTADGQPSSADHALERLVCGRCGGEIAVGEIFLRRAVSLTAWHGRGLTQAPVCAQCRPLTVIEGRRQDG